jgi:hypothetical protein
MFSPESAALGPAIVNILFHRTRSRATSLRAGEDAETET